MKKALLLFSLLSLSIVTKAQLFLPLDQEHLNPHLLNPALIHLNSVPTWSVGAYKQRLGWEEKSFIQNWHLGYKGFKGQSGYSADLLSDTYGGFNKVTPRCSYAYDIKGLTKFRLALGGSLGASYYSMNNDLIVLNQDDPVYKEYINTDRGAAYGPDLGAGLLLSYFDKAWLGISGVQIGSGKFIYGDTFIQPNGFGVLTAGGNIYNQNTQQLRVKSSYFYDTYTSARNFSSRLSLQGEWENNYFLAGINLKGTPSMELYGKVKIKQVDVGLIAGWHRVNLAKADIFSAGFNISIRLYKPQSILLVNMVEYTPDDSASVPIDTAINGRDTSLIESDTSITARDTTMEEHIPEDTVLVMAALPTWEPIQFNLNSFTITDHSKEHLQQVISYLKNNPERKILLTGYTDNTGTPEYNQKLSKQRAEAVSNFFKSAGIDKDRIIVEGKGMADPKFPNDTRLNRMKNRRVEFLIK